MNKDVLLLQIERVDERVQIESISSITLFSLTHGVDIFQCHFGRRGMDYQRFAPYAKSLLLLLKEHCVISESAGQNLSLLRRAYLTLSFKLSCQVIEFSDVMALLPMTESHQPHLSTEEIKSRLLAIKKEKGIAFFHQLDLSKAKPVGVPKHLQHTVDALPNQPGVYIFYDKSHTPIYIGKSIHIKERVRSHFSQRYTHPKELKLFEKTQNISHQLSNGEFGALLLESQLIKKYRPIYNRRLRRVNQIYAIKVIENSAGYALIDIARIQLGVESFDSDAYHGFYRSQRQAKSFIEHLVKDNRLCGLLTGLEHGQGPCFRYQINKCDGACIQQESPEDYNQRLAQALTVHGISDWPYQSSIAICENGGQSALNWHVFDKWCYLGSAKTLQAAKQRQYVTDNVINDIDATKYLTTFMKHHKDKIVCL